MIGTTAAILGATLASTGAGIAGSVMGANAQRDAAQTAAELQWKQYEQNRADYTPYREAGTGAVKALTGLVDEGYLDKQFTYDDLTKDPSFQFRLDQGQKALERSAAAKGQILSGGALKALTDYSQGMASTEYQNAYQRWASERATKWNALTGVANLGMGATAGTVQSGTTAANSASEAALQAGNASAAGWMGMANGVGNAADSLSQYSLYSRLFGKTTPSTPSSTQPYSNGD